VIFFFNLFGVYKKALTFAAHKERKTEVMNNHTSINLAVLHIIRVVVIPSRA
jgi:hypothetical protein